MPNPDALMVLGDWLMERERFWEFYFNPKRPLFRRTAAEQDTFREHVRRRFIDDPHAMAMLNDAWRVLRGGTDDRR